MTTMNVAINNSTTLLCGVGGGTGLSTIPSGNLFSLRKVNSKLFDPSTSANNGAYFRGNNVSTGWLGTVSSTPVLTWSTTSSTTLTLAASSAAICTAGTLCTLTLPASGVLVGNVMAVISNGAGGIKIAQRAGQSILYDNASTTVGVSGSITFSNGSCVYLVCAQANFEWIVMANTGTITRH